jgi:hypothetical protein
VGGELVFQGERIESEEEVVHLGHGNPEAGFIDEVGVGLIDDLVGKIEAGSHFFEPGLFLDPVLIATGVPPADVVFVQFVAALGKFLDDFGVGGAIAEHDVDELAVLTREPGDFTGSPPTGGHRASSPPALSSMGWKRGSSFIVRGKV